MYGNTDSRVKHPHTHSAEQEAALHYWIRTQDRNATHVLYVLWSNITCFQHIKWIKFCYCHGEHHPHLSPWSSIRCTTVFLIQTGFAELLKRTKSNEAWTYDMDRCFSALWLIQSFTHTHTHVEQWANFCFFRLRIELAFVARRTWTSCSSVILKTQCFIVLPEDYYEE